MRNLLLTLEHAEYEDHVETWWEDNDGGVYVESRCPHNSPSNSDHRLSFAEALRQYALLRSEGWNIRDEYDWHEYVDEHSVPSPVNLEEALDYVDLFLEDLDADEPTIDQPQDCLNHIAASIQEVLLILK